MAVYTVSLIMPMAFYVLGTVIRKTTNKSVRQLEKFFSLILLIFYLSLSCFRADSVGTDLGNYLKRYVYIGEASWLEFPSFNSRWGFEYGFLIFCKLISYINKSEQFFLIVTSLFVLGNLFYAIKKYSLNSCLSYYFFVVFLYFGTSMNLIRLFMALSICILSIDKIVEKDLKKFIIIILIASLFHTSALVFLVLYPFCRIKISKDTLVIFAVGCFLIYFLGDTVILFLLKNITSYYYARYAEGIGSGSGTGMLLLLVMIFAYCFWNQTRIGNKGAVYAEKNGMKKFDEYHSIWMHMLLLAIALNMLALRLMVAGRLMWYMKISLIFLLPNTFQMLSAKNKSDILAGALFIVCCIILPIIYYNNMMNVDNAGIVPYFFY